MRTFIEQGADVNARTTGKDVGSYFALPVGTTPLIAAAAAREPSVAAVKRLLRAGARVNVKTREEPGHNALERRLMSHNSHCEDDIVTVLHAAGETTDGGWNQNFRDMMQ